MPNEPEGNIKETNTYVEREETKKERDTSQTSRREIKRDSYVRRETKNNKEREISQQAGGRHK